MECHYADGEQKAMVEGELEGGLPLSLSSPQDKDLEKGFGMVDTQAAPPMTNRRTIQTYRWEKVSCSYGPGKKVLHEVSGCLKSGELLALMGPSGSGKTTLLDILTLRKSVGKVDGYLCTDNGVVVTQGLLAKHGSYMPQEVLLLPMQTTLETLTFQAKIRLGRSMPAEALARRVTTLLQETGLGHRAHQRIGGILPGGISIKGLSGGEKKRLALCCCVIHDPEILFVDEVTSGLDSRAALQIMKQVQNYCNKGFMCITTIHQPRSAIWQLFDKVVILGKGHQLYFGDRSGAEPWFTSLLGASHGPDTTTVDWLLDVVNTDFEGSPTGGVESRKSPSSSTQSIEALTAETIPEAASKFLSSEVFKQESAAWPAIVAHPSHNLRRVIAKGSNFSCTSGYTFTGWLYCYRLLLQRSIRNCIRNPGNLLARAACNTFVSLMSGLIFYQVAKQQSSPFWQVGLVTACNFLIFGTAVTPFAALSLFINDRAFFLSDNASGLYPTSAYYLANMTTEIMLAVVNAVLYATIAVAMTGLLDLFVDPWIRVCRALQIVGVIILSSMMGSAMVQFFAVLAPNFDVAFVLNASNVTFALLTGGAVNFYPNMSTVSKWLTNFSFIRFIFQTLVQLMLEGTPSGPIVKALQLDHPLGVQYNLPICFLFYLAPCLGTYLCLRFLYKERR